MEKIHEIENCCDCPFGAWRDNAFQDEGGTVCVISEIRMRLNENTHRQVHKDCPLKEKDFVEIYKLAIELSNRCWISYNQLEKFQQGIIFRHLLCDSF